MPNGLVMLGGWVGSYFFPVEAHGKHAVSIDPNYRSLV